MKIVSWNVNGIRACVRNGFEKVLQDLQPDIIGLQEIKIDNQSRAQHEFDFTNYQEYFFGAERKGYSGTGILSRQPWPVKFGIDKPEFDSEGRIQTLDLGAVWLINAYFPNAQPELARLEYKEAFNKVILEYAKKLDKEKPVIITGDFNVAIEEIDLARPKENVGNPGFSNEERYWGKKFLSNGFVDTFRALHPEEKRYSWWSYRAQARGRNVGWRIDYFMVSERLLPSIKSAEILDQIKGSDHAPILLEINLG